MYRAINRLTDYLDRSKYNNLKQLLTASSLLMQLYILPKAKDETDSHVCRWVASGSHVQATSSPDSLQSSLFTNKCAPKSSELKLSFLAPLNMERRSSSIATVKVPPTPSHTSNYWFCMKTAGLIRATNDTPTPRCAPRHKRAPKQREWWMRALLEESITYCANGAVPETTTRHQRGVLHFHWHFFHSAGADNCSAIHRTPSKTHGNFSIIVLKRHDHTAGLVRNKQE